MKRFTFALNIPYPVLPWRLIALLALALVLFIFVWMIFLGPFDSRRHHIASCDKLEREYHQAVLSHVIVGDPVKRTAESAAFERGGFAGFQALGCVYTR